jgi:hypothetical protein
MTFPIKDPEFVLSARGVSGDARDGVCDDDDDDDSVGGVAQFVDVPQGGNRIPV